MKTLSVSAPAKINLTLDILGLREDGYHEMEMVMESVTLCDTITLELGKPEGIRLISDNTELPDGRDNLAVRAAYAFREAAGQDWNDLCITLRKRIPVCAGTAGGSSDAAAVLRGLNELTGNPFTPEQLAEIGAKIGSDVPYCVLGGTRLARGRGELLSPLPQLPHCWIVLCKPPFPISTPALFRAWDNTPVQNRPDTQAMIAALQAQDINAASGTLGNVFEDVLPAEQKAEIDAIKKAMLAHGALGAAMSGSGPTVFGIFSRKDDAQKAYDAIRTQYSDTFLTEPARA